MKFVVLTGGVASGKTTAGKILREKLPESHWFDCDAEVKKLYEQKDIHKELICLFGENSILPNGEVNRDFLREKIFQDKKNRALLEGMMHPKVRELCLQKQRLAAETCAFPLFVADIPLYFESGVNWQTDCVVLVAVSREVQIERLMRRDSRDRVMAEAIVNAQKPLEDKIIGSDIVLWNEGSEMALRRQIEIILPVLNKFIGK